MNIKEIFTKDHSHTNSLDDVTKVSSKSASAEANQTAEDLKDFDELMKDCQNIAPQLLIQQTEKNSNNLPQKVDDKFIFSLKNIGIIDNNFEKLSNLKKLNHLSYLYDFESFDKKHKINLDSLSEKDFKSIKQMLENPNLIINNMNTQNQQMNFSVANETGQISYKSMDFSKTLFNMIQYSYKSQKPIRLDFNNDSSVILKIDKEGKLSAEFMAGSKGMELLLKDNLQNLKNKLDSEGISYGDITYRDRSKKQDKKENKGG